MLHIIAQYKQLFTSFVMNSLESKSQEGLSGRTDNQDIVKIQEINTAEEKIRNTDFFKKLPKNIKLSPILGSFRDKVTNQSRVSRKKEVQESLNFLGYDISFTNKQGQLISGKDAVDGDLGSAYKRAMKEMQKDLGISITGELDSNTVKKIDEIRFLLNNDSEKDITKQEKDIEKKVTLKKSQKDSSELSTELPEEKPETTVLINDEEEQKKASIEENQVIKTKEVNKSDLKSNILNLLSFDIDANELKNQINQESFNKLLLSVKDINELYNRLREIANKHNLRIKTSNINNFNQESINSNIGDINIDESYGVMGNEEKQSSKKIEKEYNYSFLNVGELKAELKKVGYENEGFWFLGKEVGAIMELLENVVKTQNKIPSLNFREKLAILLDSNADTILDNDVHFYTKEKELFNEVKNETEFSNLVSNLGYNGIEDFNTRFSKNYFAERKNFEFRLGAVLAEKPPLDPAELLLNPNGVKEYSELKEQIKSIVESEVNGNDKLKGFSQKTKDLVTLSAISVILGSRHGTAISFDVKELTKGLIDKAHIGYVAGIPGIAISKTIIETDDGVIKFDMGIVNFIPYGMVTVTLNEGELDENEFKELYPKEIDASTRVIVGGTITAIGNGSGIYLDVSKVDETTKLGIKKAKQQMSKELDMVFKNIQDGKSYEDSDFKGDNSNKSIYNSLSDLYNNAGLNIQDIKEGTLNNYEMTLYKNAEGFNFTGGGLGLVFISGYLPIPVIFAHGEYHSTDWEKEQPVTTEDLRKLLNPKPVKEEVVEEIKLHENIDGVEPNNQQIAEAVLNLDNTITKNTRVNKYAFEIMDPNATIESRWEGFKDFAKRKSTKNKFSSELQKTIDSFKKVLVLSEKIGISENDKLYIISTIVQLMKKANDTKSGSLENYNKNLEGVIHMKNERRGRYNKLFGFNIDKYSALYDNELREAVKDGGITEMNTTGVSFDASASKQIGLDRTTIEGVDVFYSNIQILCNKNGPILLPIKSQTEIDSFIKMLENKNNINVEMKNDIINGLREGILKLNYYSDPDGFDDRLLLTIEKGSKKIGETELGEKDGLDDNGDLQNRVGNVSVWSPEYNTTNLGVFYTLRTEKKTDDIGVSQNTGSGTTTGGSGNSGGNTGGGNVIFP